MYMCMCICMYVCIYIYIYTCIYIVFFSGQSQAGPLQQRQLRRALRRARGARQGRGQTAAPDWCIACRHSRYVRGMRYIPLSGWTALALGTSHLDTLTCTHQCAQESSRRMAMLASAC